MAELRHLRIGKITLEVEGIVLLGNIVCLPVALFGSLHPGHNLGQSFVALFKNVVIQNSECDIQICLWIVFKEVTAGIKCFPPCILNRIAKNASGDQRERNAVATILYRQLEGLLISTT